MSAANSANTHLISIDELDHAIVSCAARINAATYEMLLLVRQFDERAGFLRWGLGNCAEWLAWRCDLSLITAKEKLRTAHALKVLPAISEAFSVGELSYTKVRELTRVANRDNEQNLLDFALRTTATHVAQRCRELRMGDEASIDTAARAFANRSLRRSALVASHALSRRPLNVRYVHEITIAAGSRAATITVSCNVTM